MTDYTVDVTGSRFTVLDGNPVNVVIGQSPGFSFVVEGTDWRLINRDTRELIAASPIFSKGTSPVWKATVRGATFSISHDSVVLAASPTIWRIKIVGHDWVVRNAATGTVLGNSTPSTIDDGSAGATGGLPQRPHLLIGYAHRPPWKVAGVDYAVGCHLGGLFKSPSESNLPGGTALGNHVIYVEGNNVTLSGYDLTGYTVLVLATASGTVTIVDCLAYSNVNIRSEVGATARVVIRYCTFDGGGESSDTNFQMIKLYTPATIVEYCVLRNNSLAATYLTQPTCRFNLVYGFGWHTGEHTAGLVQQGGGAPSSSCLIAYNTLYCGDSRNAAGFPIGIGTGIPFYNDAGGNFYNGTVVNNVVIANLPGGASYLAGFYVTPPGTATNMLMRDNYFDPSNAFGAIYKNTTGNVQATYSGNIDMRTGASVD